MHKKKYILGNDNDPKPAYEFQLDTFDGIYRYQLCENCLNKLIEFIDANTKI